MYFLTPFCGVCLTDCKDVQNIKNKDVDDISIVEKLKYCCFKTAWIDDDLSLFICYKCYFNLKIAYSFKKMCVSNSTILKGYVSRLKYSAGPLDDHEHGELKVELDKNKVYGVNLVLYERVQVEEVDMDASSSEDESNIDVPMDIVEENKVRIKLESNVSEAMNNGQSDLVSNNGRHSEQTSKNRHDSDVMDSIHTNSAVCKVEPNLVEEIVDIKEETSAESEICFVEVKQEFNSDLCVDLEPDSSCVKNDARRPSNASNPLSVVNILPSLPKNHISDRTTLPAAPISGPSRAVNLLNIMNDQISHFLTSKQGKSNAAAAAITSLRSLLDASTVAQSRVIQSLECTRPGTAVSNPPRVPPASRTAVDDDDDVECLSSNSDTISAVEDDFECSMLDFAPEYSGSVADRTVVHGNVSVPRFQTRNSGGSDRSVFNSIPAPHSGLLTSTPGFTSVIRNARLNSHSTPALVTSDTAMPGVNNITERTALLLPSTRHPRYVLPTRGHPRPYPSTNALPQRYPLLNDTIRRQIPVPPPYPDTGGRTQPAANTFLIIYDDINQPPTVAAAPQPAHTHTHTHNGYILREPALVPNTGPYKTTNPSVSSVYVVPSTSTAPLVVGSATNSAHVLPTTGAFTYRPASNNVVTDASAHYTCRQLSDAHVLPTTDSESSPDSEPSDKPYTCPVCKSIFAKNRYLKQHLETHYSVTYRCKVCAKNFMCEKTLKEHILVHNKSGVKYQCDYCYELFAELSDFKRHGSIHAGVKQFQCSVCEKRFINRSSLTKHLVSHSDGTSHPCRLCDQVFQYKCRLENHMLRYHNVDSQ